MKSLIIIVNVLLGAALAMTTVSAFKSEPKKAPVVAKRRAAAAKPTAKKNNAASRGVEPAVSREQQISTILSADMFNSERTPNAASGRFGNRVELSLVGTFEAGKIKGAVILYRTNTRQINPFMQMMWGGGRGGMPRGGRGVRRFMMPPGQNNNQRRGGNPTTIKQYVRLGETMPNGYTLTALSRDRATLTRGGDKMELELQMPSKNQNGGRGGRGPRLNVNQQLQQAQLQTQQMMVRALMEMRQDGNSGGGNRGRGRAAAPRRGR